MQVSTSQQPTPSLPEFTQDKSTPMRSPSSGGFSPDFVNMYSQEEPDTQAKQIRDEVHAKATDWLSATPGVMETDPTASGQGGVLSNVAAGVAVAPLSLVEDLYNTGVDLTNWVSKSFGGGDVLNNTKALSQWMPDDAVSVTSREISKFMVGYGALVNGASKVHKASTVLGKMSQSFAAGAVTDLVTAQPDADSLFESLVKKLPFGADIVDLISDEDDTRFNKRVKEVVYGGVTGVLAEGLIKGISHYRGTKKVVSNLSEPPAIPKEAGADVADIPKVQPRDELPPLPETDFLSADLKPMSDADVSAIRLRQSTGQGSVNTIEGATDSGEVFVNLTKMNTTDDVRKMVSNIVAQNPDAYAKPVYTTEEIARLASEMNMTPETLSQWTQAQGLKMGEVLAARTLADEAAKSAANALKRLNEGAITKQEAGLYFKNFERIQSQVRSMENLSGLLLRESGIPVTESPISARSLEEYTKIFGDDLSRIGSELEKEASPQVGAMSLLKSIKKLGVVGFENIAGLMAQGRYASMLSDPATHLRNLYGVAQNTSLRVGETTLAATFNAIKRDPHGVTFSDAYHEALGMFQGGMEAFTLTYKKLRGREATFLGVNPKKSKLPSSFQKDFEGLHPLVKGFGNVLSGKYVGDALRFEDDFMKHINARMTLNREAYKKGYLEGTRNGLSKEDTAKIIADELKNPSDRTLQKMFEDAEYYTLTNDVFTKSYKKGELSTFKWLEQGATSNPIARLVAPFAKTNINAMSYKLERIPGANILLDKVKADFNSKDPFVRQMAAARMTFASTTMVILGGYLHSQDAIIGTGPTQSERWKMFEQSGYMRNSIQVGGESIEFRPETPLGGILSIIANVAELMDVTDDEQMVQDVGLLGVSIIADMYNPEFVTESIGVLGEAIANNDADSAKKILQVGGNVGSSFLPYTALVRKIQRTLTEEGAIKRETTDPNGVMGGFINTLFNQVLSTYYPSALAVRRDILGYPMKHKQGLGLALISPFGTTEINKNPVMQELYRLTGGSALSTTAPKIGGETGWDSDFITVQMPSRVIELQFGNQTQKRKLTPDQYEQLVQFSAGIHPTMKGRTLENSLKELFEDKRYKESSMRAQGVMAKSIIDVHRETGKALFLQQAVDLEKIDKLKEELLKEYSDMEFTSPVE